MRHIGIGEGAFSIRRGKKLINGRNVRISALVFTTNDGFEGESRPRNGRWDHQEAYEAAQAARAKAQNRLPEGKVCNKAPTPAKIVFTKIATPLSKLDESALMAELERRGYGIVPLSEAGNLNNELATV